MSAQTMADAWAPILAAQKEQVMGETWGHLAPKKNKKYRGHIVFAVGSYGDDPLNPTVLECEFKDLPDSPWFFSAMQTFLSEQQKSLGDFFTREYTMPPGSVYRFDGTFRNYKFKGTIQRAKLTFVPA